jgi:hypothetical protein
MDPVDAEGGQLPRNVHSPACYKSGPQSVWLPAFTASSLKRLFNHQILFLGLRFYEHRSNSIAPCSLLCNPSSQIPVSMLMASSLLIFTFSPQLQKLPSSAWNASPARLSVGVRCAMWISCTSLPYARNHFVPRPISSPTLIAQRRIQPCTV